MNRESAKHATAARCVVVLVAAVLGVSVCAAWSEEPARPGADLAARLGEAATKIRAKQYAQAEAELLALEKLPGLDDPSRASVRVQLIRLYAATGKTEARAAAAKGVLALNGAGALQRTEALAALADATDFGTRYEARYLQMRSEEELRQAERDNRLYREELARLKADDADSRIALGNVYLQAGEADKAAAEFQAVLKLPKPSAFQQGDALTGLASASLLKGDREGAVRWCKDLASRNLRTTARHRLDPVNEAKYALQFLDRPETDYLKLPYYTDAKAFPTPQQAAYSDRFVPLTKAALSLGEGLRGDDPRIELLKVKFARYGIALADGAPFTIRIGVNAPGDPPAPDKGEGYSLTVAADGAVINGRDAQGVLWGVVSLIQLVDASARPAKVRLGRIVDWPDTPRRGFLQSYWKDALEFMLFCKMNTVVSQSGVQITACDPYRPWTPLQKEVCSRVSRAFAALGLKHYFGIRQWTMYPKLPLSSERTFELHEKVCSQVAAWGGCIYFPYDDTRFPVHPADLARFGAAANMDAKYLTRLFQAVRKTNPDFRMVFCPPFYWGPDGRAAYPEPREPYLKSLGESLDAGIELIWTGPRVKGFTKNKEQVAWYAGLTRHKPFLFQNGTGPHNLLSYITDATPGWTEWHYDGFFQNDIEGFLKNAHMGAEAPQTTTLADCLWNVKAYDPDKSIRKGVAMLYGKEMFDILDPANQALAYLDKYKYGQITPEAMTEIPEIRRRLEIAEAAYARGEQYNAFSLENFPGALKRGVDFARDLLAATKNPPDFFAKYRKNIADTRELAAREAGADASRGHILKMPTDFLGGEIVVYANRCPRRLGCLIRGRKTPIPKATARFECDPFPPSGPYELHVCAQDDEADAPCRIRIRLNDATVFEGPSGFVRNGWSLRKFVLPAADLKRYNALTIECMEDSSNRSGPPWFIINYAVVRKSAP